MIAAVRQRLTYSNVIATMALFIALGGVAVAAGLPKNSVGANQLKRGAVTAAKIRKQAVTSAKLAPKSVIDGKLGAQLGRPGQHRQRRRDNRQAGANSVIASTIKNSVVTTNKLNNEAVTTPKLAATNRSIRPRKLGKGSVTAAKLSDEIGPLLGTLKSGQTLRGMFDIGGGSDDAARSASQLPVPTAKYPARSMSLEPPATTTTACPGSGGGNQTPQATPGKLCVYVTDRSQSGGARPDGSGNGTARFGLRPSTAIGEGAGNFSPGQWAVTAP